MSTKDIMILAFIVVLSVGISLSIGYRYALKKNEEQTKFYEKQSFEIEQQRYILDSLRIAGNQTITLIEKRYYEAKRPIPIIDNEDSLLLSVNQTLSKKNPNQ